MNQKAYNQLAQGLPTRSIGKKIIFFDEIGSTSDYAREIILGKKGKVKEGTMVIAAAQTKGRGQFDRSWHSPKEGGVYLSLILTPPADLEKALPAVSLMAGAAVAESLEDISKMDLSLKYPNDIYLEGRKVGGILTERVGGVTDFNALCVILGVGINLYNDPFSFPKELQSTASSILHLSDSKITPMEFVQSFSVHLETWYDHFLRWNFLEIVNCWKKRMAIVPKEAKGKLEGLIALSAVR